MCCDFLSCSSACSHFLSLVGFLVSNCVFHLLALAEVHADQSTEKCPAGDSVLPELIAGPTNGADVDVDELTFSSGKSPLGGGNNADEKASGAGGVGQCTPEVVFNRGASEEARGKN